MNSEKRFSQILPEDDPVEILREGRKEMRESSDVRELKERLSRLAYEHSRRIAPKCEFYLNGIRANPVGSKYYNISKIEYDKYSKMLEENEREQQEISRQIQEIEDKIKQRVLDASKRRKEKDATKEKYDSVEILKELRESPRIKELKKRLRELGHLLSDLLVNYNDCILKLSFFKEGSEAQINVKNRLDDIKKEVEENEKEQIDMKKEIERVKDDIRQSFLNELRKREEKK